MRCLMGIPPIFPISEIGRTHQEPQSLTKQFSGQLTRGVRDTYTNLVFSKAKTKNRLSRIFTKTAQYKIVLPRYPVTSPGVAT